MGGVDGRADNESVQAYNVVLSLGVFEQIGEFIKPVEV